MVTKTLKA